MHTNKKRNTTKSIYINLVPYIIDINITCADIDFSVLNIDFSTAHCYNRAIDRLSNFSYYIFRDTFFYSILNLKQ